MELKVYPAAGPFAAIVLAHGAGAGQTHPFMVRAAQGFAERGLTAATFDFPYMAQGRKVPDRAPVLEAAWRDAISAAREGFGALPLFIGGKSMGGRIATHVAAQGSAGIRGVVCLGYPLHPPANPGQRRDAHLPAVAEPMLFVQGSRDGFGTSDDILALLPSLQRATLHEVKGGDHSFKVPAGGRPARESQESAMNAILDGVALWARGIV